MECWNVKYLVIKNFCLLVSNENIDYLNKKTFSMEKLFKYDHKKLLKKPGFVFMVN